MISKSAFQLNPYSTLNPTKPETNACRSVTELLPDGKKRSPQPLRESECDSPTQQEIRRYAASKPPVWSDAAG